MTTYEWITTLLVPLTGVVSWLAGTRKRNNDAMHDMQTTIDLLAERNREMHEELVALRKENAELKAITEANNFEINNLKLKIEKLSNQ